MPLTRWILASRANENAPAENSIVNTLYFNVAGLGPGTPDYDSLGNDLWTLWAARSWNAGRFIDIRGYSMDDPEPRPQRYRKAQQNTGSGVNVVGQVALCLSYYADRNLPRMRGRIYTGPWAAEGPNASAANLTSLMTLPPLLAGLGGVDVDWSLWSPTTQTHTRINHAWCDDSWDIIRSRKIAAVAPRRSWTGNG